MYNILQMYDLMKKMSTYYSRFLMCGFGCVDILFLSGKYIHWKAEEVLS